MVQSAKQTLGAPTPRAGWQWELSRIWATFFYSGLAPKMPGTCGSLLALPCAWWLWQQDPIIASVVTLTVFISGTIAAHYYCLATQRHDNQEIVIDEVLGVLLTVAIAQNTIASLVLAFLLFRIFDITKPFPVGWVDRRVSGGIGVMLDDVVAALWAMLVLWITQTYLFPLFPLVPVTGI